MRRQVKKPINAFLVLISFQIQIAMRQKELNRSTTIFKRRTDSYVWWLANEMIVQLCPVDVWNYLTADTCALDTCQNHFCTSEPRPLTVFLTQSAVRYYRSDLSTPIMSRVSRAEALLFNSCIWRKKKIFCRNSEIKTYWQLQQLMQMVPLPDRLSQNKFG